MYTKPKDEKINRMSNEHPFLMHWNRKQEYNKSREINRKKDTTIAAAVKATAAAAALLIFLHHSYFASHRHRWADVRWTTVYLSITFVSDVSITLYAIVVHSRIHACIRPTTKIAYDAYDWLEFIHTFIDNFHPSNFVIVDFRRGTRQTTLREKSANEMIDITHFFSSFTFSIRMNWSKKKVILMEWKFIFKYISDYDLTIKLFVLKVLFGRKRNPTENDDQFPSVLSYFLF